MALIGTDIIKAQKFLSSGKLVAIPTETVYGLAGNANDAEAVESIYEVKNRPFFDPLILHLYNSDQIEEYCVDIPEAFYRLYKRFSPGPITYILKRSGKVLDIVTAGQSTVAVRFPSHPLTRELLKASQLPLAAPSANPFGYISPTTAAHVEEQLGEKISFILDGGSCQVGVESTIVDLSKTTPSILRLGGITVEELEDALGHEVEVENHKQNSPKAPGMLASHYAPAKALEIGDIEELINKYPRQRPGIISLKTIYPQIPARNQRLLSPKGDLSEAAMHLFSVMRQLDKLDVDIIFAEKFPDEGVGRAINDRLSRAAVKAI